MPRREGRARPVPKAGGTGAGAAGTAPRVAAGLDSRQEEAVSRSTGIEAAPERWGPSEKRWCGRGSPAIRVRISRFRGSVQQHPVQRQNTQIVQSCMTLDDFMPGFRPRAIRRRFWPVLSGSRAATLGHRPNERRPRLKRLPARDCWTGATRGRWAGVRKRARPRARSSPSGCRVAPSPIFAFPASPAARRATRKTFVCKRIRHFAGAHAWSAGVRIGTPRRFRG